jgi:hypothetical protein
MLVRAMKVLVLIAGCVGMIGFFEPFFDYGDMPVSAYRVARGFDPEAAGVHERPEIYESYGKNSVRLSFDDGSKPRLATPIPIYFASALVFLVVGFTAIVVGRFSGLFALFSLAASMLALGGWLRELRIDREITRAGGDGMMVVGAKLLLLSGLLGLLGSIVVLIKREPAKPKPPRPPPELPEARVVM